MKKIYDRYAQPPSVKRALSYTLAICSVLLCATSVMAQPVISSLSSSSGKPGASITISGGGFNATAANNKVYFGATRATVSSATATSLSVTVPVGATFSPVTVTNSSGHLTGSSQYPFLPSYDNSEYIAGAVNFDANIDFTNTSGPSDVAIGDIDGDGKADMVTVNYSSNTISVYRNTSSTGSITAASFAAKVNYTTGTGPSSVALGDYDGDGMLDIAVTNMGANTISLFRNQTANSGGINAGGLSPKFDFASTGTGPGMVCFQDMDGDGKPDMIVANSSNASVGVFRNTSTYLLISSTSFAAGVNFSTGTTPYGLAVGDIDGDGKPDIITCNNTPGTVSVLRNTATTGGFTSGSFAAAVNFSTGLAPQNVSLADIDGDGKQDILTANNSANTISILRNTSTSGSMTSGSMAAKVDFATGNFPYDVTTADVDGDGKADIIVTNGLTSNTVSVFRNTASSGAITSGSLATRLDLAIGSTPAGLAVGDLDGDGKSDLVTANSAAGKVSILHNDPPFAITGTRRICLGSSTTLTSTITGGAWSSSNTATASVGSSSGVVSGISAGTVVISYSGTGGSGIAVMTIDPIPNAGTISGVDSLCTQASATMATTGSGGLWSVPGSAASIGATTGILFGSFTFVAANPTVYYIVSNSCGADTATKAVYIKPLIDPGDLPLGLHDLCVGATTSFASYPALTPGGTWYIISGLGPDPVSVNATTGVITGLLPSPDFNVNYATPNECGTPSITVAVRVLANSAGTISGPSTYGVGASATLSSTVSGGIWSSSNSNVTVGSSTGLVTGVTSGSATISYTVSNSCGTFVATKTVTVDPGIIGTLSITGAGTTTLSSTVSGGTWSTGCSEIATITTDGVVTAFSNGLATVTYITTSGTSTAVVTVNMTTSAITGTLSACAGASTALGHPVSGGTWSSGTTAVATVGTSGVVAGVAAGTAKITYTYGSGCKSITTVTINSLPYAGVISGPDSMCQLTTATLSSSVSGGAWISEFSDYIAVNATTGVLSSDITLPLSYTYGSLISYIVTNGCGADTVSKWVTGMPQNYADGAIAGPDVLCAGATGTYSISASAGFWVMGAAGTATATIDSNTGVLHALTPGWTVVQYGWKNTFCPATWMSKVITINPTPATAGTISGGSSVVIGSSITLSSTVSGGTWSASNSNATVSSTGVVTGVTAGTLTISYSVSNSCGTAVSTTAVTVNGSTAVSITGTLTVCNGATTALGASVGGGTWSSSDASIASVSASGVVSGVSAGTTTIVYTTATSSATTIVTVTGAPSLTGAATLCPGATTALTGSGTGGTWTGGSTVVATVGSTGVVTGIGMGTTTITYSTGTGCNATITITVNSAPNSITGTLKACLGTATTLSCMTAGGAWTTSDPATATADPSTGAITGVAAGTVTVTYTAGAGCYRTTTVTINPDPAPIGGALMICAGSSTSLTDVTPGLSWNSSNTAVASIASSGVVSGVSAGNATITYTAASTNCITTAIVTVNGVPAAIGGPATGCTGSNITLTNSVPGGAWSGSNPAVATVDASTGVVTGVTAGMATITYAAGAGCIKTKAIAINNSPNVTGYPMACVGSTTTLSGGSSGTWSSGTPSVATITTSGGYVSGIAAGTSTMTFTSTSTTCPATYIVSVIPTPSAITGTTVGCQGSTVTLSNSTPGGSWSSNNTAIASVGSTTGVVTAVGGGGTASISYSFGNCRVTAPFSPKPLPAMIGGSTSVCTPVTTTLTCTTGGGTWSSSDVSVATVGSAISVGNGVVTGVAAGNANITYTITTTGCARSAAITVNTGLNPGTITSSGGLTLHTVSSPTSVTLSSTGASGGTWASGNPAVATVNAATGVVTAVAAGTTTITYAVTGNCTNIATKVITVTAGRPAVSQESSFASVQLYPNPTTGAFTLVSEKAGILNVFSIDGKEITNYNITAGINPLNLPVDLASGIYMCRYTSENGSTTMVRLVYER